MPVSRWRRPAAATGDTWTQQVGAAAPSTPRVTMSFTTGSSSRRVRRPGAGAVFARRPSRWRGAMPPAPGSPGPGPGRSRASRSRWAWSFRGFPPTASMDSKTPSPRVAPWSVAISCGLRGVGQPAVREGGIKENEHRRDGRRGHGSSLVRPRRG